MPTKDQIQAELERRKKIKAIEAELERRKQANTQPVQNAIPKGNSATGLLDAVKVGAQNFGANVIGGWEQIYNRLSGMNPVEARRELENTIESLGAEPSNQKSKLMLQEIGKGLNVIGEKANQAIGGVMGAGQFLYDPTDLEKVKGVYNKVANQGLGEYLADATYDATGNEYATASAAILPDVAEAFIGKRVGANIDNVKPKPKTVIPADELIESAEKANVPLLTTDVYQPSGFMSKSMQRFGEKLGMLGTGQTRIKQQIARQQTVEDLASEFGVQMDSPFAEQIIKSLSEENARRLQAAQNKRQAAINSLAEYGDVSINKVSDRVSGLIQDQERLRDVADTSLIKELQSYENSLINQNFQNVAKIRSQLINKIKDLEGTPSETRTTRLKALTELKAAIDDDMLDFAKANDRPAAAQWLDSNRKLAEQLTGVKRSELKRLIEKGDVKPELLNTILRGGKRSELRRLRSNLSQSGIDAVRASIVRDALDKSGLFRNDANPNKLATELGKTNLKQAVDIFFNKNQKRQLDGLERLLNATRRAQDADLTVETGQQMIPLSAAAGIGWLSNTSPIATIATASTVSGLIKGYESKAFRNLLMKIERTKKGSIEEKRIFEVAIPTLLMAQQAPMQQEAQQQDQQR